ncbi:SMP-30/gluconolactonase/LRE family protein [Autumnicola musiva]|uniref:SMP-30/gluconolactonase/LRE family protein n=1 Tax=Autumnicola musiva TaxID=3075589 RepID=A0ABU3D4E1_9FLAO|nr:SMP-30/gluconolactonase/LRE family protein [Zunongwangia sp. F117]MDT0676264.1 SMP-30/gluconolactonase/LRE family protein [Zunongwangia sp. F117]
MYKEILTISAILFMLIPIVTIAQHQSVIAENAGPELVSDDFEFTEGPAADRLGNVYFTDQPNNNIHRWNLETGEISVFLENAKRANGLFIDNEGNILACADKNFQLIKITPQKEMKVLIDNFEGKNLNGPNDLWMDNKGGIYLTDPYYQRPYWERTSPELESQNVYYLAPGAKSLVSVAKGLVQPNGIIGTPDGKKLYVADIGDNKTYSYSIAEDGSLYNRKLFVEQGSDGMTLDNEGNVYLTGDGVTVYNENGEQIHHIPVDEDWTANVTFGGENHSTLFITAMDALYSLEMKVKGTRW